MRDAHGCRGFGGSGIGVPLGVLAGIADDAGRNPDDESVVGDVVRDDCAGPTSAPLPITTPATMVAFDPIEAPRLITRRRQFPVVAGLQAAVGVWSGGRDRW